MTLARWPRLMAMMLGSLILMLHPGTGWARRLAPITGTLSKPGYSVIALGYNGRMTMSKPGRTFKLVPPAKRVTLQLRGPDGRYAGPVVVGHRRKWLVVGLTAGARLNTVTVKRGYATVGRVRAGSLDDARVCQASHGVPLGNGLNFGFVRSRLRGKPGPGNDSDLSCVPGAFNVAANGKRILNAVYGAAPSHAGNRHVLAHAADGSDPSSPICAPQSPQQCAPSTSVFWIFSEVTHNLPYTVNVDAGSQATDVDAGLENTATSERPGTTLELQVAPGGVARLDCGGLTYCAPGGTGHLLVSPQNGVAPIGSNPFVGPGFPACCNPDANGWGEVSGPGGQPFGLLTLAPYAQIGTGDVYVEHITEGGTQTDYTGTLNFAFDTTPALHAYSDGDGHSATISYPPDPNGPGTYNDPFAAGASPSGERVLTFTFWRPQRPGIAGAGEPQFMDMGHLNYTSYLASPEHNNVIFCGDSAYSTGDPNLTPQDGGLTDQASDAAPSPANTLSYSLDVTKCLSQNGASADPGDDYQAYVRAADRVGDYAETSFRIRLT